MKTKPPVFSNFLKGFFFGLKCQVIKLHTVKIYKFILHSEWM